MQEHREGPLQDLDAGDAERAAIGAAASLRGARVLRTARQGGRRGLAGRQVRQRGHLISETFLTLVIIDKDQIYIECNYSRSRMMWVASFAVSVYGSCQARAGHKPFNPLLGETFECVREDRGFKYVAEQVTLLRL